MKEPKRVPVFMEFMERMKDGDAGEAMKLRWDRMFLGAVNAKDRMTFRQIADLKDKLEPLKKDSTDKPVETKAYGAELISSEALIYANGYRKGNNMPEYGHIADASPLRKNCEQIVLTGVSEEPFVVVELPGKADIAGITVYPSSSSRTTRRDTVFPLVISVSEDGEHWKEVRTVEKCKDEAIRIDFGKSSPTAQYVRLSRKKGVMKESLILRKVLIYGDTQY